MAGCLQVRTALVQLVLLQSLARQGATSSQPAEAAGGALTSEGPLTTPRQPVYTTPPPYQWLPQRPAYTAIQCLGYANEGCSAVTDEFKCLRSKDGREERLNAQGLRIRDEPCVWCGGRFCHSNKSALCEPLDILMHGKGKAFGFYEPAATYKVAECKQTIQAADVSCLDWNRLGCFRIAQQDSCLRSRDGTDRGYLDGFKIGGQSCVWCGGGACTSKDTAVCAPYDWLLNGQGKAFTTFHAQAVYRVASCQAGRNYDVRPWFAPKPIEEVNIVTSTMQPYWRPPAPAPSEIQCLRFQPHGCSLISDPTICLGSRDGRNATTHNVRLKLYGQPCVWCGGGRCTSDGSSLCEPFNYLMYGEGSNLMDPKEFITFHAKGYFTVAKCKEDKPVPLAENVWGGARPLWVAPPRPQMVELSCLRPQTAGCRSLVDMGSCLDSVDGSSELVDQHGFKLRGEPCVWCRGLPCIAGGTALCQPFDHIMHGEGKAFDVFAAKDAFTVATCKPRPDRTPLLQQKEELACLDSALLGCASLHDERTCLASRDGQDLQTIAGLGVRGQACVWCGGLPCSSADNSTCGPYDYLANGQGRVFLAAGGGRGAWLVGTCHNGEPSAATVPPPPPSIPTSKWTTEGQKGPGMVAPYGQCGGSSWSGPTACGPRMVCRQKSAEFWQCLPQSTRSEAPLGTGGRGGGDCWSDCGKKAGLCEHRCGARRACCPGSTISTGAVVTECVAAKIPAGASSWCVDVTALPLVTTAEPPEDGRFVKSDGEIWWHDLKNDVKHFVPSESDCSMCGCGKPGKGIKHVKQEELDVLPEAVPFNCGMVPMAHHVKGATPKPEDRVATIFFAVASVFTALGSLAACAFALATNRKRVSRGIGLMDSDTSDNEEESIESATGASPVAQYVAAAASGRAITGTYMQPSNSFTIARGVVAKDLGSHTPLFRQSPSVQSTQLPTMPPSSAGSCIAPMAPTLISPCPSQPLACIVEPVCVPMVDSEPITVGTLEPMAGMALRSNVGPDPRDVRMQSVTTEPVCVDTTQDCIDAVNPDVRGSMTEREIARSEWRQYAFDAFEHPSNALTYDEWSRDHHE